MDTTPWVCALLKGVLEFMAFQRGDNIAACKLMERVSQNFTMETVNCDKVTYGKLERCKTARRNESSTATSNQKIALRALQAARVGPLHRNHRSRDLNLR